MISENVQSIKDRVAAACRRSGRSVDDVRLIAVTKKVDPERVAEAFECGLHVMGDGARGLFHLPGLERMEQRIGLRIDDIRAVGPDWRIIACPAG